MKAFFSALLKTLNPRYYRMLGEKKFRQSTRYFNSLLFFSFILLGIILLPSFIIFTSQLRDAIPSFEKFEVTLNIDTKNKVSLPMKDPILTIDTNNDAHPMSEPIYISDERIIYDISNLKGEIDLTKWNIIDNPSGFMITFYLVSLLVFVSLFILYYLAYLVKYAIIILICSYISYLGARMRRNIVTFKQVLTLSIYTATPMVLLEILTVPFFFSKYLISYTPFVGFTFSVVAITAYLSLFTTAVRINGNREIN